MKSILNLTNLVVECKVVNDLQVLRGEFGSLPVKTMIQDHKEGGFGVGGDMISDFNSSAPCFSCIGWRGKDILQL